MTRGTEDYRNRSDERSSGLSALVSGARELGIELQDQQLLQFQKYRHLLLDWNQRINLTSIVDPTAVEIRHFLDSLTCIQAAPELFVRPGGRVVDVGSGAGFPGVPVNILNPDNELTLIESRGKRAEFLSTLVNELDLRRATVVAERAEIVAANPEQRDRYDVALARALAELPVLVELCLPLVRPGGVLIAHRRGDLEAECVAAQAAVSELGGEWESVIPVRLQGLEDRRGLVVARKMGPTPERYPRRPGVAAKRPITG